MPNRELLLYFVHGLFWASFGAAGLFLRRSSHQPAAGANGPTTATTAPYSRTVLAVHFLAFGVMYFGVGKALFADGVPEWVPGQRLLGTAVIAAGAALMSWARVWFQSWRFRAKLDAGHQLATGGPFRWLRHPIYMGLNLLALGTAMWVPTAFTCAAVALMVLGGDLRARAEERLLLGVFGPTYASYANQTKRFLPGLY